MVKAAPRKTDKTDKTDKRESKRPTAAPTPPTGPVSAVEEVQFRSESAYLCALVNRRTRMIRVIDFRAGALPAKRTFIENLARREGVEKILLLVEKDEVSSWTKVGFAREGTVPGFYKRSDGHLVGLVVSDARNTTVSDESTKTAERTLVAAKKRAKELDPHPKGVNYSEPTEDIVRQARDTVWAHHAGIGSFDPFGRHAERLYLLVEHQRKANFVSAEYQDWFGHSLVEVLRTPASEVEIAALAEGVLKLCEENLKPRGIVSAFAFAPVDDVALATVFTAAGFRRTGLVAKGTFQGTERVDAILWTRKLANPDEEDDDTIQA
jgi:hypothetical protein